jgi:outer membrane lipoprotein carrier protein
MIFFKKFVTAGCLFIFFLVLPAHAESVSLNNLIEKLQERYERAESIEARFIQKATIKSINKTETEEGTVYFKKPKKMRWVYTKPDLKELVINPQIAWFYIPEDSLVYIQNAKTIFNSKLTIRFLSGIGKLKDDFQVNFSQPTATDEEGNYILDLVPKGFEAGIEKILLVVNKSNFQIMEFSLTDIYGNVTQIIFKNMKTNTKLLDTLFTFTPPPGVEIYDMRNK